MIKLVQNNTLINNLPHPTAEQLEQSELLTNEIASSIKANHNWLSFKDYMNLALYHPQYGYYTSGCKKIGESGDFITAPELGPLFAYGLAKQIAPIIKENPNFNILEFGAGSGKLALSILQHLEKLDCLPNKYYILDLSSELKDRQQKLFANHQKYQDKITWLDRLPEENNFNGIILANEVVDAMPINIFEYNNMFSEVGISIKNNSLTLENNTIEQNLELYLDNKIKPILDQNNNNYYTSEVNLLARDWLLSLSECLSQGLILLIDYGFSRSDYYNQARNMGTLMCHYKHFAHQDPLLYPGLQDITSHVDFTSLAEIAIENELTVNGYYNQANFLLANNILDYFELEHGSQLFTLKQELKKLTSPHEMGELFKVLLLTKNLTSDYFSHLDRYDRRGLL